VTGLADALNSFYRGKRVLVTGHTGLKGSWLTLWLRKMGADTVGLAMPPDSPLSMFSSAGLESSSDRFVDLRGASRVRAVFHEWKPEIVFHLAAQAIVGVSYRDPVQTYETNVMGTAHVLECLRTLPGVRAALLITSDKCYENIEQIWGYREHDRLGGHDPYSSSKAAAEVLISSYTRSYFCDPDTTNIASARSGNVVAGGDWSEYRLIPDCVRALRAERPICLRNPLATRPWQHVLEPLAGYLQLGRRLVEEGKALQGAWNFGPSADNAHTVEKAARSMIEAWGQGQLETARGESFHETTLLQLDCTKAHRLLGWKPVLDFETTMRETATWYRHQHESGDASMRDFSLTQLLAYEQRINREVLV
jgi:CDP-glucose 4,6-dehydratase